MYSIYSERVHLYGSPQTLPIYGIQYANTHMPKIKTVEDFASIYGREEEVYSKELLETGASNTQIDIQIDTQIQNKEQVQNPQEEFFATNNSQMERQELIEEQVETGVSQPIDTLVDEQMQVQNSQEQLMSIHNSQKNTSSNQDQKGILIPHKPIYSDVVEQNSTTSEAFKQTSSFVAGVILSGVVGALVLGSML
eukprot:TRINITY_DN1592_c0_g1_i10.p3 TRINITY_DN1592_c0_g1~~TRINITY_DN1592_c0_g1_i10.p3  ORF type:complete len:195 (-),score=23.69 TRINITY_DN1592_c0_g1_i10:696-1280(-)